MTTTSTPERADAKPVSAMPNALASGRLRPTTPWLILAGSMLLAIAVFLLIAMADGFANGINWTGAIVLGAVFFLVAVWLVARIIEGARQATNRFVTSLVATAFVIALIPLISLIGTLVSRGIARFDLTFFTWSMVGVVAKDGGGIHAIVGTLLITLTATVISVPIGLFTAIYLVEYGKGWLSKSINFFVDVMTGVPSIVAGLFAYTLFMLVM